MSKPPPEDLMDWTKGDLAKEVARLRAVLREHSKRSHEDPRPGSMQPIIDYVQDPHARGSALIDAREAILMDSVEVVLADTKKENEQVVMMLSLGGRVNYSTDRATHGYLFNADGAAAIVTEITALASRANAPGYADGQRFADEFRASLEERLKAMP